LANIAANLRLGSTDYSASPGLCCIFRLMGEMANNQSAATADYWGSEKAWVGTRAPLNQATGLNPAAYTSTDYHQLEQQQVFERAWVCVGIADDVAEPGRMLVRQLGSRSILITRDHNGVLQGFLNSCRHRGTELAESDCDVANPIRCPYHRWGYSLDGSLIATPSFEEVPRDNFDKTDFGLAKVRVDTWGVLVFACLDESTPPLLEWLGDLPKRMAGYQLEGWNKREQQTLDESDLVSGRFVAIFPNVLLSVLPNHVFVMQLDPVAPGVTKETCSFLLPSESADADEAAFAPTRKFWLEVNAEDIDIVERGQRGLTAGRVPPGPLSPRFEEPLHRFHNILANCMSLPSLAGIPVPKGDSSDEASRLGTKPNPTPPAIDG